MTLTQDQFFGAIQSNLGDLARNCPPAVPQNRLHGAWRLAAHSVLLGFWTKLSVKVKCITDGDCDVRTNLRAYDLYTPPGLNGRRLRFRVVAYFIEGEPTAETYRLAKRRVLAWHNRRTDNGRSVRERFDFGALVIGSPCPWAADVTANGCDMPEEADFQLLAAPFRDERTPGLDVSRRMGDYDEGRVFFRALEPESFDDRRNRVLAEVEKAPDGAVISSREIADRTGVPLDDVRNMFEEFQGAGRVTLAKTEGMAVKRNPGMFSLKRIRSQAKGRWYGRKSTYAAVTVGVSGLLSILIGVTEKILPHQLLAHRWLFVSFGVLAICWLAFFGFGALIRRK